MFAVVLIRFSFFSSQEMARKNVSKMADTVSRPTSQGIV